MIFGKQIIALQLVSLMSGIILAEPSHAADFIAPTPWSTITTNDLSRLMPQGELKPLLAGDTEFLSLYREHMSAPQRGVILIIPDWQHLPTNNDGINFLRTQLNDLGYATIAMTVPDIDWQATSPDNGSVPSEPADTTQTTDIESNEPPATTSNAPVHVDAIAKVSNAVIDNYKLNLIARFNALYQSALDEDGKIVVIAQGASAGVLLEHYGEYPNTSIDAFVSLSSYIPNSKRNQQLNAIISTISPPLLDIYYSVDSPDLLLSVSDRKRWVKRHSKYDYRQRELFGLRSEPQQHERLTKEIDGFLRRLF